MQDFQSLSGTRPLFLTRSTLFEFMFFEDYNISKSPYTIQISFRGTQL